MFAREHRERDLARPLGRGGQLALLMIGIDNIAALEELFGEAVGDEVIEVAAARLARAAPRNATLWQAEHRRFALSVPGLNDAAAGALAAELQAEMALSAVETSLGPVGITLGIGCAIGSATGQDRLGEAARDAMQQALGAGVGSFRMAEVTEERRTRRDAMAAAATSAMSALGNGDLTIAYQPVVRANGGPVVAFHECLVRLRGQDGALVPAAAFMPAIERLGLAPLIDRKVLDLALNTLAANPRVRLSVNIYPQTMLDSQWQAQFRERVAAQPDLAERLIVEVTETAAMESPERTQNFMDDLRKTGVSFALDDFGAGHTSFRNLRTFRFDIVKLDGRFVENLENDADDRFFARLLTQIADRFDMMTVAEFVRSQEQAHILRELGIGYFQGFHFGAPGLDLTPTPAPRPLVRGLRSSLSLC